jgi:hypothetical protein
VFDITVQHADVDVDVVETNVIINVGFEEMKIEFQRSSSIES